MSIEHIYSQKIGFHAPVTRFIYEENILKLIWDVDYSRLPSFLDIDKTKELVSNRISKFNMEDHFLYSLLYLSN